MLRSIGAVVLGIVVAIVVLMWLEVRRADQERAGATRVLFINPPPAELDDPAAMSEWVLRQPARFFYLMIAMYFASGLAGGWVAGRLARRARLAHGAVVGVLFTLAGIVNIVMLSHPMWAAAGSLVAQFLGPLAGARLSGPDQAV